MRARFHTELDELISHLARMVRLAGEMMTNASIALHQVDVPLATLVLADYDRIRAMYRALERRCVLLLALEAPVAGDLRVVVAALHSLGHAERMGNLARHVAVIAQFKSPNPMTSAKVRPVLARMSLLASQLAVDAATAVEYQDPLSGCRLAVADDEVDALRRNLFGILFADDWPHSVEQAVDTALTGRFYERFGDHAVAIARSVCYRVTGEILEGDGVRRSEDFGKAVGRSDRHR
jgi:phosphate transport system protein